MKAGALPYLSSLINHQDNNLKRHVCNCLAQISKHNVDLAEIVVSHGIFPTILNCLKNKDMIVKKNAATCIREISRQSRELSTLISNSGGSAALVDFIGNTKGVVRLPGIMTLGYIASFDDVLAM